jgi:ribosomal protein S18 acetylase RimI-like enzyme
MLYIKEEYRRRGIGIRLIKHLESKCKVEKLFTSTNKSNKPMQKLLNKMNYQKSGIVHNLDPGDPELFYFKKVKSN